HSRELRAVRDDRDPCRRDRRLGRPDHPDEITVEKRLAAQQRHPVRLVVLPEPRQVAMDVLGRDLALRQHRREMAARPAGQVAVLDEVDLAPRMKDLLRRHPPATCSGSCSGDAATGSTSTGIAPPSDQGSNLTRSAKNSHIALPTARIGSAISAPTRPLMLAP